MKRTQHNKSIIKSILWLNIMGSVKIGRNILRKNENLINDEMNEDTAIKNIL